MTIDYVEIRTRAEAEVTFELAETIDPFEQRSAAREIRARARKELFSLKKERQQLIAAAALYYFRSDLHEEFGISRLHMRRLAVLLVLGLESREDRIVPPPWPADRVEAARAAGIRRTRNAVTKAAEIAARYEYVKARRVAADAHLESAKEMVRTVGGRFVVEPLERPDFDAIRETARQQVVGSEGLSGAVGPEERLRLAADIVDLADEEASGLLRGRNSALNTLAFYSTARGVYLSAGLTRQGMLRVMAQALRLPRFSKLPARAAQPAAARAAGVWAVPNAAAELPRLAKAYEAALARRSVAIEIRDAAVLELYSAPHNWNRARLAEAINRDQKIVARVVAPETNP